MVFFYFCHRHPPLCIKTSFYCFLALPVPSVLARKTPPKKNSTNKDPKTKVIDGQVYTQDDGRTMTPSDQYKILEDDPGNLPRILIGAGLKYDMIHERCFPFQLNAKYRVPDFGEFNFEAHKTLPIKNRSFQMLLN